VSAGKLATTTEAIEEIRAGRLLILVDDEDRENEGDLVVAADHVTPEAIAFMLREGRGLVCAALDAEIVDRLHLLPMTPTNLAPLGTAFTVSVDAAGDGNGLSATDRAHVVKLLVDENTRPNDLVSPGHIFPLRARPGGSLVRSGQTEGSVDLARLAGCSPAGVICEVMRKDGRMARLPELLELGERWGIKVATVADLIAHRLATEMLVREHVSADLPTQYGDFRMRVFRSVVDDLDHVVLQLGDLPEEEDTDAQPVLVRVHRADLVGDTFGRFGAAGDRTLHQALDRIRSEGSGVLLYLEHQDLKWTGLAAAAGSGATPFRAFGIGAQILRALGLRRIRPLTSNPRSFKGLKGFGLQIEEFVPLRS
jgi:3,4-dihydroxy 2-butanone 4-phosphate synthase / GTP cyclohydrolase II